MTEVIDKKEDSVKVKFVDHGNTVEVAGHSLKYLSSKYVKLPRTCLSCVLHDVTEEDLEIEKPNKWLQENLNDQAVRFEVVSAEHSELSVYLDLNGQIDVSARGSALIRTTKRRLLDILVIKSTMETHRSTKRNEPEEFKHRQKIAKNVHSWINILARGSAHIRTTKYTLPDILFI